MVRPIPTWYLLVAVFASTFVLAAAGAIYTVTYTKWAIAQERAGSIQRRCAGIQDEIEFFRANPPETDRQFASQDYWNSRFKEEGC